MKLSKKVKRKLCNQIALKDYEQLKEYENRGQNYTILSNTKHMDILRRTDKWTKKQIRLMSKVEEAEGTLRDGRHQRKVMSEHVINTVQKPISRIQT